MRILFFPSECCAFHGLTLEERPLGGTETAIIHLSNELQRVGHEVYVVTEVYDPPETPVVYLRPEKCNSLGPIDILVACRGWRSLLLPFKYKKCFFWTGDSFDNLHNFGIGDGRFIEYVDGLFAVSQWHAQTLCETSGFPAEKTCILRNGVILDNFQGQEQRHRKRLIYTSTPSRGMIYLPKIYSELKSRHPDLELWVFSSFDVYVRQWLPYQEGDFDKRYESCFEELRRLPDCHVHGSILQKQLAREFMKSAILAYPSNFEETSCITAMEAQAAGCVVVSSHLAALPETVGDAGVLIQEVPGSELYIHKYIEACDQLLKDDALFKTLSNKGIERANAYDWKERAVGLLQYLKDKHGMV
jgi:glycosyltransferase involved in cell wall biosynthesis